MSGIIAESFLGSEYGNEKVEGQNAGSFYVKNVDLALIQMSNPIALLFGTKYLDLGVTKFDRRLN